MRASAITEALEQSGLRLTPQRHSVLSFLAEHRGHPTAAEIFTGVNRRDPRSSRATTYNNLRDLVQAGLVREVAAEGRVARFDVTGLRHHHFICDSCGRVEDLDWYDLPAPPTSSLGGRTLRQCELIVRGLCSGCLPTHAQHVSDGRGAVPAQQRQHTLHPATAPTKPSKKEQPIVD